MKGKASTHILGQLFFLKHIEALNALSILKLITQALVIEFKRINKNKHATYICNNIYSVILYYDFYYITRTIIRLTPNAIVTYTRNQTQYCFTSRLMREMIFDYMLKDNCFNMLIYKCIKIQLATTGLTLSAQIIIYRA